VARGAGGWRASLGLTALAPRVLRGRRCRGGLRVRLWPGVGHGNQQLGKRQLCAHWREGFGEMRPVHGIGGRLFGTEGDEGIHVGGASGGQIKRADDHEGENEGGGGEHGEVHRADTVEQRLHGQPGGPRPGEPE